MRFEQLIRTFYHIHLVGATILQVPAPILGALLECLAGCRTPTRRGERFDHHFIILPRCSHVTGKAEYKTSSSCTAVMVMSVSLAGVTCNFPDVLITTEYCDSAHRSHKPGRFSYHNSDP
jgi:hypothetical protein